MEIENVGVGRGFVKLNRDQVLEDKEKRRSWSQGVLLSRAPREDLTS